MKKLLKFILFFVLAVLIAALGLLIFLSVREYDPEPVETVEIMGDGSKVIPLDSNLTLMTWNIGYCGLGKDSDFVMDGGGNAPTPDEDKVNSYIDGVKSVIDREDADILLLQEVDSDASRTYGIDERSIFIKGNGTYAMNYSCDFVPFPWPPIGKIHSGIFTTSDYQIEDADRYSLPCPFSWPLRVANLKRCLLVSYFPIENSDKELVVVNLHLEAYDSGEGKIAQTKQLIEFLDSEYEKGNYVIAGGDWNQVFPGSLDVYPNTHSDLWEVGVISEDMFTDGWSLAYDLSTPSCRLLNQPYDPSDTENTQYYVIDGFIYSPNIQLDTVETVDASFDYSDHNPVLVNLTLKSEN